MSKRPRKKPARPIGNRRDYEGASKVAKRLSREDPRDSAAELRLQSLLRELDKYDETTEEDDSGDSQTEYDSSGPRRRWSDDEQSRDE
jgi:hypothetical protein